MKKFIFLSFACISLAILGVSKTTNSSTYIGLTLVKEAEACVASVECPDGSVASCTGTVLCLAYSDHVTCDGNQSAYC